jgi:hypothetical protein
MNLNRDVFLKFSSEVTGYSPFDLEGTGLVDTYCQLLQMILGPRISEELGLKMSSVLNSPASSVARREAFQRSFAAPSLFQPVAANLILLWYLGTWYRLTDTWYGAVNLPIPGASDPGNTHVPSINAYIHQLSYRSAFVSAPGSNPPGFASWAIPPHGREEEPPFSTLR